MDIISTLPAYLKYFITGIGSLLAILGLFVDKKSAHFKYIAPLFIVLICTLGGFQAIDAANVSNESKIAKDQRKSLILLVDRSATTSSRTSSYLSDILLSQPKILRDFGLTSKRVGKPLENISTSELVQGEILAANKYRVELIEANPPSTRMDTQLWYYNKELDTPELEMALSEIGFTVVNKVTKRNMADQPTNAVWYGPDVELEDYKAVIVSLIRAGIDIQRTGPACKNLAQKRRVIEIGSSAAARQPGIHKPTKSIQQIRDAKTFEELNDLHC